MLEFIIRRSTVVEPRSSGPPAYGGWPGWVGLGSCLGREIVAHSGTNRARCITTSLVQTKALYRGALQSRYWGIHLLSLRSWASLPFSFFLSYLLFHSPFSFLFSLIYPVYFMDPFRCSSRNRFLRHSGPKTISEVELTYSAHATSVINFTELVLRPALLKNLPVYLNDGAIAACRARFIMM